MSAVEHGDVMITGDLLEAALQLAESGFRVLPLHSPDPDHGCSCRGPDCESVAKHPRTQHGVKDASTDPEVIRRWWRLWPGANLGIATGDGLVVLDVDPRHAGDDSLQELEDEHGEIVTRTVYTGGGGTHLYLQGDLPARGAFRTGLDLKAAGGYVVAPPSLHGSGRRYEWVDRGEGIRVVPDWLTKIVRASKSPNGGAGPLPDTISSGQRNKTLISLAGSMRRPGMDAEELYVALSAVNDRRCDPPLPDEEVRGIATSVTRYEPAPDRNISNGGSAKAGKDTRPTIPIRQELTAVTEEAIEAVAARPDLGVYVRGRNLVTVSRDGSSRKKWLRRPPETPVIVPIEQARMLATLDLAAEWVKWDGRLKVQVPQRPPDWVAIQILARLQWPYPYLEAVIETPTLRPDASIIETPGWDEETGLLYEPMPGIKWPPVVNGPTDKDVREAVTSLLDPVLEFPFVADTDRAAYVAAIFTILARDMIDGPTPMFPVRAPTPGTGKTLLTDVIGLIGTGRKPSAMSMTYENEELRKRITSLAMEGTSLVLLDNLSGSLGSDALAAALTATEWEDRVLGSSQMVRVPLRAVWLASGNNLGFRRTLGRRVVPIDLDAEVETPEDRTGFKYDDLKAHVRETRPQLVIAALTLLRGFHLAGRPKHGAPRMGSFEAWDDLIRSAVVWAGLDDPATADDPTRGRGRIRTQADDDTESLGALLEALSKLFNSESFVTSKVIQRADQDPDFRGILDTAAAPRRGGGRATGASLGATFREAKDRPIGGLVLRRHRRTWSIDRSGVESDT